MNSQLSFLARNGFAVLGLVVLLAGCGGGGGGGGSSSGGGNPPVDTTPNGFTFADQTGMMPSTVVTSAQVTITGINAGAAITVTGGEYSIEDGAFTSAAGTINNNQRVRVRLTASSQFSTQSGATLSVGGVSATFNATTVAADTTPAAFQFAHGVDGTRDEWINSDSVTITEINTAAPVSIVNGEYSIDGGAFTNAAGTVADGQSIVVRVRASASYSRVTTATLTVGTVTRVFEVTSELPAYLPDGIAYDGSDTVYLLNGANRLVFRWIISESRYIDPLAVAVGGDAPLKMAFSPAHHRLYFGYFNGAITQLDVTAAMPAEQPFATAPDFVAALGTAGNFVIARAGLAFNGGYVYDAGGAFVDHGGYYYGYSAETAWDPVNSRLYYTRDAVSPNDLHYDVIDQASGEVSSTGETPYHGHYPTEGAIRVSADGQHVLLGSGDIFSLPDLEWSGSVAGAVTDARWSADGSLVTLRTAANQTTLRRLGGANLAVQEQRTWQGQALRVVGTDAAMVVLVNDAGNLRIHAYSPDDDSDDDGTPNTDDAFPLDPAASVDVDHDGFPDAWNAGRTEADSTTGLVLDSFPQDAACWLGTHAGTGGTCDYGATLPDFTPDQVAQDGDLVYLLSKANRRVYRWSISAGGYINPYVVGVERGFTTDAPDVFALVAAQQRLYLGYANGAIRYIDLAAASPVENHFVNSAFAVNGLASAGNFLAVRSGPHSGGDGHLYDAAGVITAQGGVFNGYSAEANWDPVNSRLYYTRSFASPENLHYETIDQATGEITGGGQTPYHGGYQMGAPVRVSANGQRILLGSGDLFRHTDLTFAGSLSSSLSDARWLADGGLVTLTAQADQTTLRRLAGANYQTQELIQYTGTPVRVLGSDAGMVVLVMNDGVLAFHPYTPNPDADGDGVTYPEDAFPLDVAASADGDGDGHPDAWNPSRGPADSTTGLGLDAFPQDEECWLPAHGSGGECDYGATLPAYVPDAVAADGDVIYLLSRDNHRVYRWSTGADAYLKPWKVGVTRDLSTTPPDFMTFSGPQQRLYLGYASGAVHYITPAAGVETPFLTLDYQVEAMSTLGSHLLVVAGTSYMFNGAGGVVSQGWGVRSRDYTFDPVYGRLYYFSDNSAPNDLYYTELDPVTGEIGTTVETPHHGAYDITPPILVSPDGARILLGSGDIYRHSDLTWTSNLGAQFVGGRWLANGNLVTLGGSGGTATLRRSTGSFAALELHSYPGEALDLVGTDAAMTAIVMNGGWPRFHDYVPNDDVDGDGVANTIDAFLTDVAASMDTDHDGRPDAWNPGRGPADSTTGLVLDVFPLQSGCWLPAHATGGVCDPSLTVPQYVPDEIESLGDTVYLLSAANRRVYRWSVATGRYLDPYVLGVGEGGGAITTPQMAVSAAHQRLYLGYESGAIRYFDVSIANPAEVQLAATAKAVYGLGSVGNFVLAMDQSGGWGTHYVFDSAGALTDSEELNYLSRDVTWDPVHSRVYYFSNFISPTDLHYEVIDQVTGEITARGETPYHGEITAQGPIRVSTDGERVLLGSGSLLDRESLTFVGSIGPNTDARFLGDILVTVDWYDGVHILDSLSLDEQRFDQYAGGPRALVFGTSEAYLVHVDGGTTAFVRLPFYDQDTDGMTRWWEELHGLDDANGGDATADGDGDGASNLLEFQNGADPQEPDTDGDGLTDGVEILTHGTDPANADSDDDGLDDEAEVVTHLTDPWDTDTDGDDYTDLYEVLYGGDPNNVAVLPQPITGYTQGFEGTPDLAAWAMPAGSFAPWTIDTTVSRTGAASFRSGLVGHYQHSATRFRAVFPAGTLSFHARVSGDSNFDRLEVRVDGDFQFSNSGDTDWILVTVPITAGLHEIEIRYQKDSFQTHGGADAAWIDDLVFTPQ